MRKRKLYWWISNINCFHTCIIKWLINQFQGICMYMYALYSIIAVLLDNKRIKQKTLKKYRNWILWCTCLYCSNRWYLEIGFIQLSSKFRHVANLKIIYENQTFFALEYQEKYIPNESRTVYVPTYVEHIWQYWLWSCQYPYHIPHSRLLSAKWK